MTPVRAQQARRPSKSSGRSLASAWVMPVSYTHLDVYKRQHGEREARQFVGPQEGVMQPDPRRHVHQHQHEFAEQGDHHQCFGRRIDGADNGGISRGVDVRGRISGYEQSVGTISVRHGIRRR